MEQHSDGIGWVILGGCIIVLLGLVWGRKKRANPGAMRGVVLVPVQPQRKRQNWLLIAVLLVGLVVAWHYATLP